MKGKKDDDKIDELSLQDSFALGVLRGFRLSQAMISEISSGYLGSAFTTCPWDNCRGLEL